MHLHFAFELTESEKPRSLRASSDCLVNNLLDELSHVLAQRFTARPLALPVAVERMGASVLLVTVRKKTQ